MEKRKAFEKPLCMRCDAPLERFDYIEEEGCMTFKCPNCRTIEIFTPCDRDEEDNYAFFNESVVDDLGNEEHGYHGLCPQCGSHIIWGADFMRSEVLGDVENEDDDSIASSVSCPHCGGNIQIIDPKPSEYL